MIRTIVKIDEEKCNGCGLCADACLEKAIAIVDGKAKLIRDDYCDGLGNCLPACPMDAISFEEREAAAYDEAAVEAHIKRMQEEAEMEEDQVVLKSHLNQWPCQIKLLPTEAPFFVGADILIAADCTAYAYANIHQDFMRGRITLVGCPKLDMVDYSEKLTAIFRDNDIKSVTMLRMEVPCCGGLERATKIAIANSGKDIPLVVKTVSIRGELLN